MISSVSGGSITAAKIALEAARHPFDSLADFDRRVADPIIALGQIGLRRRIMAKFRPWRRPRDSFASAFVQLLDQHLFDGATLRDLAGPINVVINATSLHTGRRFRFKCSDVGDSVFGVTEQVDGIAIAFAVAASACFPMMFAALPFVTEGRLFWSNYWDPQQRRPSNPPPKMWLTDGGVYDNLGSEPLLRIDTPFLMLDASRFAEHWSEFHAPNYFARNWRPLEIGLDQLVLLRRRLLFQRAHAVGGLLLMLRDPIAAIASGNEHGCWVPDVLPSAIPYPEYPADVQKLIAGIRTDLDAFSNDEIECLMWAGAARVDVAIRRFGAFNIKTFPPLPTQAIDVARLRTALSDSHRRTALGRGRRPASQLGSTRLQNPGGQHGNKNV